MKRIKNKEFMLTIQNLLCAEEHTVDMLLTAKENEYSSLKDILDIIKLERNLLLNFPEEKDRNKWCLIKHLLLANYHSMEMINNGNKGIDKNIIDFYIKSNTIINSIIDKDLNVECNNCKEDLLLFKLLKGFDKK